MGNHQLTSKQRRYLSRWFISGEGITQAARESGYTGTPYSVHKRLMNKVNFQRALADLHAARKASEEGGKTIEAVIVPKQEQVTHPAPVNSTKTDALRDALRDIMGDTLDEARVTKIVRNIIREEAGLQPIKIEVATPAGNYVSIGTQHKQFAKLVRKLDAGCNVYLAGAAGTGKTTAAREAARALSEMWGREVPFYFNGAIDSEHKLLGFTDAQGRVVNRPFREAFTKGGVYLFDEVDASLAGALLAFNAALANGHCDFPDGCFEKHPDFRCIAAANTWGFGATHDYVGRAKLDEAFRDRFVMLNWETDETLERHIALQRITDQDLGGRWVTRVQQVRSKAAAAGIRCVISPRASINGCALLQAGEEWDEVEESCIRKGMAKESWDAISK